MKLDERQQAFKGGIKSDQANKVLFDAIIRRYNVG